VIADYYDTSKYGNLTDGTKRTYRRALEKFRQTFGPVPVAEFTPAVLDEVLETLAAKPGARENLRKVLRLILKLAVRRGLIKVSPMDGCGSPGRPLKGFRPWSDADIAAYEKRGPRARGSAWRWPCCSTPSSGGQTWWSWAASTPSPARSMSPRPRAAGRRGYGC
jgi:hypothetical protein